MRSGDFSDIVAGATPGVPFPADVEELEQIVLRTSILWTAQAWASLGVEVIARLLLIRAPPALQDSCGIFTEARFFFIGGQSFGGN